MGVCYLFSILLCLLCIFPLSPSNSFVRYLLSTGINIGHTDFGGRATHGYNGVSGSSNDDVRVPVPTFSSRCELNGLITHRETALGPL